MNEEQKTDKKELKIAVKLFIIAMVGIGIGGVLLGFGFFSIFREDVTGTTNVGGGGLGFLLSIALLPASYVVLIFSALANWSYRKNHAEPGKMSLAMLIIDWIFICPVMFFMYVNSLSSGENATKKEKKDYKIYKAGVTMFAVSLIGFPVGIILLFVGQASTFGIVGGAVLSSGSYLVFLVAAILNALHWQDCREEGRQPEKLCKVMYIITWVFVVFVMVIMLIVAVSMGIPVLALGGSNSAEEKKVQDKDGNESTLSPTYSGFARDYYKDEDGEEWVSKDDGQTFEKLIKETTITDEDGKEYHLTTTVPTEGGGTFTDQNGDTWWTNDGKNFKRL